MPRYGNCDTTNLEEVLLDANIDNHLLLLKFKEGRKERYDAQPVKDFPVNEAWTTKLVSFCDHG